MDTGTTLRPWRAKRATVLTGWRMASLAPAAEAGEDSRETEVMRV